MIIIFTFHSTNLQIGLASKIFFSISCLVNLFPLNTNLTALNNSDVGKTHILKSLANSSSFDSNSNLFFIKDENLY
jgi:hypothetical protein